MRRLKVVAQCHKKWKKPHAVCFVRRTLGGRVDGRESDRSETVYVSEGCRTIELALFGIKAARPVMDTILLITDNDVRRRRQLRRFFSGSGFLVAAASNGLECLATLVALEPDVLVVALEIPWGAATG